jgi:hypothetical protein
MSAVDSDFNAGLPVSPETARSEPRESVMKYRLVARITDDQGTVTETELLPEIESEAGWRCDHAVWPEWVTPEQTTECGWCRAPLIACEIVACPWCEWYVPTEQVLAHWGDGCEE